MSLNELGAKKYASDALKFISPPGASAAVYVDSRLHSGVFVLAVNQTLACPVCRVAIYASSRVGTYHQESDLHPEERAYRKSAVDQAASDQDSSDNQSGPPSALSSSFEPTEWAAIPTGCGQGPQGKKCAQCGQQYADECCDCHLRLLVHSRNGFFGSSATEA